ncbi:Hypp8506 [Branchiostoma lanceolatum]|uniref:Hypp8506 protein n=1 Tax=Branchiostoma lanceolatum TaxID=7740 RepID=A0A8K0EFJ7_BRALA|nr:Hypp8506 [Branchiostoma lanceolatum]
MRKFRSQIKAYRTAVGQKSSSCVVLVSRVYFSREQPQVFIVLVGPATYVLKMGKTPPCFRLCFLTYTLAVLFETGGMQPTMATIGCTVVRLSGEYFYQSRQMTTYSVTDETTGNRPIYASDTTNNFLHYQESENAWFVGSTPRGGFRYLGARAITDCGPVPVTPGVTSVRPSHGANITVGQTVEVACWNDITVTVQCLQNGSFDSSSPFCPEPTTTILETSEGSTTASPELHMDDRSGDNSTNIIPIVGGVVAGLVFVVIAAVAAFFFVRKRNAGLDQETRASSQRGTNLGNSTYYEPVMSDVVLTDTGAQYLPHAARPYTSAAHPRATGGEPQYSTIPEYSTIDEMDRKGVSSPQTKNNNLDQLYSKPVKKTKDSREEGMVDNVLYETRDVIDGEGATGCNGRDGYVDNDMYG